MFAEITAALRRGDAAAALTAAQSLVAAEPDNAQAHHLLGLALRRNGQVDAARAEIDRAIGIEPENPAYQLSRASLALGERDLDAAEQGMKDTLALDPNHLPAYVALVHMSLAQGRVEEAAQYFKRAQRVDPDHPEVLVAEGQLLQAQGRLDEALKCFTAVVNLAPKMAIAQVSLGLAYMAKQHWAFAEQALGNARAMDADNVGILRALVECLRKQRKLADIGPVLDRLIELQPDIGNRALRAEWRLAQGQVALALDDLRAVLEEQPDHAGSLTTTLALLSRAGRLDEAIVLAENALQRTSRDELWALRVNLAGRSVPAIREVLDRWRQALPESAACFDSWAHFHESQGEMQQAREFAMQALERDSRLASSQLLLMRAEMLEQPASARDRLLKLVPEAETLESRRMLLFWSGVAEDRLANYPVAASRWLEMARYLPPGVPPLQAMAAEHVPEGRADGRLLWSLPGVRVERVMQALAPLLGERLLVDRLGPAARDDGFGVLRVLPGQEGAGSAARWRAAIEARGVAPADAVDWLPHFDAYTAAALDGAKTVALVRDPRDALLNWMVFGAAQGYQFLPNLLQDVDYLLRSLEALLNHRDAQPDAVAIVAVDAMDSDPAAVVQGLQTALGLETTPSAEVLARAPQTLAGLPNQFPAGHWRNYRDVLAEPFARLAAVAQRLGYPAE